jgi:competence protein ComEA
MYLDKRKTNEGEQVDRWISTIKDNKSLPSPDTRLLDTPDWWKPEQLDPAVERAIVGFHLSKQMLEDLGEERDTDGTTGTGFVLPLGIILDALPPRCLTTTPVGINRELPVRVFLDDVFEQLANGKVTISVARLVFGVPVGLISSVALRDTESVVTIPLQAVVQAVGMDGLAQRTSTRRRQLDADYLPELFQTPAEAAVPIAVVPEPVAAVAAPEPLAVEPVAVAEPKVASDLSDESGKSDQSESAAPPAVPEPLPAFVSEQALGRLHGVDLNRAGAADLMTLRGVTGRVAQAILEHRRQAGPFGDIFALADVPGVGRATFRKITGMPYSRAGRHRREILARCLAVSPAAVGHLPSLVTAVARQRGLAGCVLTDRDGLLLAESGVGEQAVALSAIVPRLHGQVRENLAVVGGGEVQSLSIRANGRFLTVTASGDIYLTVIHSSNRLSTRLQGVLLRISSELQWLLSHRGYVATETSAHAEA